MFFKDKKVLVTGGEGFVGYHLCTALKNNEANVTCLDINLSGRTDRVVAGVKYVRGNTMDIEKIFKVGEFDMIFHLGEYARLENSFANIEQVVESNVKGNISVLEYWRKSGCKLVYAGSSTKFSKGASALELSPYTFTKSMNSELVKMYSKWFGMDYAITYFYNVYGDKENDSGMLASLIGIFARKVKNGEKLQVVLPGTQKRNFTHVADIIDGVLLAAEKGSGDDYGVCSEDLYSVLEVAEMFGGEIEYIPERAGNRQSSELLTQRIKELGWSQKRTLKEYIKSIL
ncbi:MAG: NAD-dependent epimerase/dehydratase family protein [bacterium]